MSLGYIYMHACVNGFVFHLRKWPFPISYSSHMESIESYMYTCHTHGLLESFLSKNFTLIPIYKSIMSTNTPSQDVFFLFLPPRYLSAFCIFYCLHAWMHTCTQTLIHRFPSSSGPLNVFLTIPFSSLPSHLWTNQTCPTFWHCDTNFVKEKRQKRIS